MCISVKKRVGRKCSRVRKPREDAETPLVPGDVYQGMFSPVESNAIKEAGHDSGAASLNLNLK